MPAITSLTEIDVCSERYRLRAIRREELFLRFSALSHAGDMLAVSTVQAVTVYSLSLYTAANDSPAVSVIKRFLVRASALTFTSCTLLIASGGFALSSVSIFHIAQEELIDLCERGILSRRNHMKRCVKDDRIDVMYTLIAV